MFWVVKAKSHAGMARLVQSGWKNLVASGLAPTATDGDDSDDT